MGMTKAALDIKIQQETQKSIAILQKNQERLDAICRIVDGNMRQMHAALYQDVVQLRIRLNFLLDELKKSDPTVEERFEKFAQIEAEKLQKELSDAYAAAAAAKEKAQKQNEESVNPSVLEQ